MQNLVIVLCAVLSGTAAAHSKDPDRIVARNVFCSGCGSATQPARSALRLELVSTMVCPGDEQWSMAVIRSLSLEEGEPLLYNAGRMIASTGAAVVRVVNRRVYLRNAGRLEHLDLETPSPAAVSGTTPVDRSLVERALRDPSVIATSARITNRRNGFTLSAIQPGTIFAVLGFHNGDTVKSINGLDFSTPDKVLEAYLKLRDATRLSVQIDRAGSDVTLDYLIR